MIYCSGTFDLTSMYKKKTRQNICIATNSLNVQIHFNHRQSPPVLICIAIRTNLNVMIQTHKKEAVRRASNQ